MRLYDTFTRAKRELPEPPGPIRMYFCGPTVYARAHIGNARPFVIGMWLARWLRERGFDAVLVHNITDINDKIYDAAPGASAELAERATEWYLAGHRGLRARHAGPPAEGERADPADRRRDRGAHRARLCVRGRRRRLLPRRAVPRLREALGPASRPGRGPGAEPAQGGSARLRALEGEQAGRGHVVGLAVGSRPARLAHRVLGDGGGPVRAGVRDPRRRARPRLSASRERDRAVARARSRRSRSCGCTTGCSSSSARRCRSRSATSRRSARRTTAWGREALLVFFLTAHWSKPIDYSDETLAAAEARAESFREVFRNPSEPAPEGEWERFAAALDDDFNTPEALAIMHSWRDHDLLRRALGVFGLASLAEQDAAPAEVVELAERRQEARAARRFRRGGPVAARDRGGRLGGA